MRKSVPASHFEALYAASPDPWHFADSPYEQEKYATTLASLGSRRFISGVEIGCSIGRLTRALAPYCDRLLGVDAASTALASARMHCDGLNHVRFRCMEVPGQLPAGRFDLIVLSEILYFLDDADLAAVAEWTADTILPSGVALLVNWTGSNDAPHTGDAAAEHFIAACADRLTVQWQTRRPGYRLDRLAS